MERLTVVLCVVLACVAPAMAAEYYSTNGNFENQPEYTYDGAADISGWITASNYGAWGTNDPSPNYAATGADSGNTLRTDVNGGVNSDTIRFQNFVGGFTTLWSSYTVGKMVMGDNYLPQQYQSTFYNTMYSAHKVRAWTLGLHVGEMQYGRDQVAPAASDALDEFGGNWGQDSYAASSILDLYQGNNTIGVINCLNTNTQESNNATIGSWGLTRNEIWLRNQNTVKVTIGDINLSPTMTVLRANRGTIRIEGDIATGAGMAEGNLRVNLRMDLNAANVWPADAALEIQYSELDQIISAGQLGVKNSGNVDGFFEWYDTTAVTWGNFWTMLEMTDLDGGSMYDGMVRVSKVPEPATMSLLGLGALALIRRKR